MNNNSLATRAATLALAATLCATAAGCHSKPAAVDDATLTANVQQRIAGDGGLANEPVQVTTQAGTVTLAGTVSNIAARSLAANDAAAVTGVQKVVNTLTVAQDTPAPEAAMTPLPAPTPTPAPTPKAVVQPRTPAPITRVAPPTPAPMPAPAPAVAQAPPPPPPPPPPPAVHSVTLPAGNALPVRVTQTLDSANAQPGDAFSGAIATDIVQDGMLMIPRGSIVTGHVTVVHEAAHFKGSALLTVELTGITIHGEHMAVPTEPYSVEGKGRGSNTAVKAGVGAAAGALLGGIFGGGKGAAIGAAAGGGTGVGINAVTRGQQVQIPSESVVRFVTNSPLTVRTSVKVTGSGNDPSLQPR